MSRRLPSPSLGLRTVFRQLSAQPGVVASVIAIVLLAAVGLTVLPRSLETASREDLLATLTESLPAPRNIAVDQVRTHRSGPAENPLGPARQWAAQFLERETTPLVRDVISSFDLVATSPMFEVRQLPDEPQRPPEPVFIRRR